MIKNKKLNAKIIQQSGLVQFIIANAEIVDTIDGSKDAIKQKHNLSDSVSYYKSTEYRCFKSSVMVSKLFLGDYE